MGLHGRVGLIQVLDVMTKFLAVLMLSLLSYAVSAKCLNSPNIRLVGHGITESQLAANKKALEKEAKSIPVLSPDTADLLKLKRARKPGDLIYDYEKLGSNGKAISGGIALVRGKCIILFLPTWVA